MSRHFSSSVSRAVKNWLGKSRENLLPKWKTAVEKFTEDGGSAEKKLGKKVENVEIKSLNGQDRVHKSRYNRNDKEDVISAKIDGVTCHIYEDGTGTRKKGDRRD